MAELKRQDRKLSQAEAEDILSQGVFGVLSLNGDDDYAYGIPMSYVYSGDRIYLHCAVAGDILTRVRSDSRVSFCVVGKSNPEPEKFAMEYSSVVVFGKANIVGDEEKFNILLAFVDKYVSDYKGKGKEPSSAVHKTFCIRIDVERVVGGDHWVKLLSLLKQIM